MKGKIDDAGILVIERAGKETYQTCPFQQREECPCGDWCPLFGEPQVEETVTMTINDLNLLARNLGNHGSQERMFIDGLVRENKDVSLDLCHGKTLVFDEFTDERVTE